MASSLSRPAISKLISAGQTILAAPRLLVLPELRRLVVQWVSELEKLL